MRESWLGEKTGVIRMRASMLSTLLGAILRPAFLRMGPPPRESTLRRAFGQRRGAARFFGLIVDFVLLTAAILPLSWARPRAVFLPPSSLSDLSYWLCCSTAAKDLSLPERISICDLCSGVFAWRFSVRSRMRSE